MKVSKDTWGYGSDLEHQCIKLFNENADAIGESRYAAKNQAIADGAKNFTEIAAKTGVSSFGTSNTYVPVWKDLAKFAEENKGIKNICDISNKTIKEFLHKKMNNDHNKYTSYTKTISAINKMSYSLNKIEGVNKNWTEITDRMREVGRHYFNKEENKTESVDRGFLDAKAVVANMDPSKPDMVLVAEIQYEGGTRVSEASDIKRDQLLGYGEKDGREVGVVHIDGKGGRERDIYLDRETYDKLHQKIESDGQLKVDVRRYHDEVKDAAARAGQHCTGTHDFRHSWVQEKMKERIDEGYTRSDARLETSLDIGHSREYITETYT